MSEPLPITAPPAPTPALPAPFEHRLRVRFQDVDAAGILFFSRYFEYAHAAYEECLRARGVPIAAALVARDRGFPLVAAEASFSNPTRYDDELVVRVAVTRIGATSATFRFEIVSATGEARATVRTTHVCVDAVTFRPAPWSEEHVNALGTLRRDDERETREPFA